MYIIGRGRYAREAYPRSAGAGGGVFAFARGWADSTANPLTLNGGREFAASVVVTPQVTGKFRVLVTGVAASNGTADEMSFGVNHGLSAAPSDYDNPTPVFFQAMVGAPTRVAALVVDLDKIAAPVVFPVGVPVQINAVVKSNGNGNITIAQHALQIEVQEVP